MILMVGDRKFQTHYFIGYLESDPLFALYEYVGGQKRRSELIAQISFQTIIVADPAYIYHNNHSAECYFICANEMKIISDDKDGAAISE
jgi:hypothetical protein